jgi:hypothetical protein
MSDLKYRKLLVTFLVALFFTLSIQTSAYAVNSPPVCDADGPYTVSLGSPVTLDGSGSSDDFGIVLYEWDFESDGVYDWSSPSSGIVTHTYPLAVTYTATLRVTDEDGETDSCTAPVDITEVNNPPDCSGASPSINMLWPPNQKFASVNILGVTDPDGDPVTIIIDSIFQDEPVGKMPDGMGTGTSAAQVRSKRNGKDNGRVYEISFTSDDGQGGLCTGVVYISVPHDQSGMPAINDGPLYDSTSAE